MNSFNVLPYLLQLAALLFLFFAAFNLFVRPSGKPIWGWLGMFLWLLSLMVNGIVIALHPISGTH